MKGSIPWNKGKKCPTISKSLIGNTCGRGNKGKQHNEKTKKQIREAMIGNTNGRGGKGIPRPPTIISCPYCKKSGATNLMKRWHFANCKTVKEIV